MRRGRLSVAPAGVALAALGAAALAAAGGGGGESRVGVVVAELLETTPRPTMLTIKVDQGGRSDPGGVKFDVISNPPAGFGVSVTRTVLSRGDLPITLEGVSPGDPSLVLDLPTTPTPASPGVPLAFGHRTGSISNANGDGWRLRMVVGPIACPETGIHNGELVFETRAGTIRSTNRVPLAVDVRRNRRLCG